MGREDKGMDYLKTPFLSFDLILTLGRPERGLIFYGKDYRIPRNERLKRDQELV